MKSRNVAVRQSFDKADGSVAARLSSIVSRHE
jgi:hypothetical protein